MKTITFFFVIIFLVGCKVQKGISKSRQDGSFAYVLPLPIEEEIWHLIKVKALDKTDLFFQLSRENDLYTLLVIPSKDIANEYIGFFKVSNTGRDLLINNKLYPIVFDTDYDLGSLIDKVETIDQRMKRYNATEYTIRRGPYSTNAHTFGIKFTKLGKVVN